MRKISDDEAQQLKHEVPKEPGPADQAELEEQLKEEQASGHPALDVKLPKEEEDTDG